MSELKNITADQSETTVSGKVADNIVRPQKKYSNLKQYFKSSDSSLFDELDSIKPVDDDDDDGDEGDDEVIDDGKPRLKYFCVGPSTNRITCPLCEQVSKAKLINETGTFEALTCLLSCCSCCFPIISLCFVGMYIEDRLKTRRLRCKHCKGYLGYYRRPL